MLIHGLLRNVLLCCTSHWSNQGLSSLKMIRTFCRLTSFWIMLSWGLSTESLRYFTWPSPLAGPWIPFLWPQPHRLLEALLNVSATAWELTSAEEKSSWDSSLSSCFLSEIFSSLVSHCPGDFLMASTRLKKYILSTFASVFGRRVFCDKSACRYHQGRCPRGRIWVQVPARPDPELKLPPGRWSGWGRGNAEFKGNVKPSLLLSLTFLIIIDLVLWIKHCHLSNLSFKMC